VALAVVPLPASTDVTAPVTLFCAPEPVAVTFTVNVHVPLAASVAPLKLTLCDPASAVIVPPPQLPLSPFGVDTTIPPGNVSVKPTPLSELVVFGLVRVNVSVVTPPGDNVPAPNDFVSVAGTRLVTVTLAVAVLPLPPLV